MALSSPPCPGTFGDVQDRVESTPCASSTKTQPDSRDIRRKIDGNPTLQSRCGPLLDLALRVRFQDHRQRGPKVYALHAPEVECIGPFDRLRRQGPRSLRIRLQGLDCHFGDRA